MKFPKAISGNPSENKFVKNITIIPPIKARTPKTRITIEPQNAVILIVMFFSKAKSIKMQVFLLKFLILITNKIVIMTTANPHPRGVKN